MLIGSGSGSKNGTPVSSPVISRRVLNSLPEKEVDSSAKTPEAIRKQMDRISPPIHYRSAKRDLHRPQSAGVGYQLSPRTLRRLEQKHQVAKLQQEGKLDLLSQEGTGIRFSPPVSPQTARRIVLKGGVNNRRFTVARTR